LALQVTLISLTYSYLPGYHLIIILVVAITFHFRGAHVMLF